MDRYISAEESSSTPRQIVIRIIESPRSSMTTTTLLSSPETCNSEENDESIICSPSLQTPGCLPPLVVFLRDALLTECSALCKAWKLALSQVAEHDVLM